MHATLKTKEAEVRPRVGAICQLEERLREARFGVEEGQTV